MSLARAMRRGAALNARFAVNGSQKASRSFGMAVARCAPTDGMARSPLLALTRRCARWRFLDRSPVPCRCARRLLPRANRRCRTIMADKPDKTNKLKARLPRGVADRGGAEIAVTRRMLDKIRAVYERYGFEPLETPAIEYTDALGKFLPDQDRPNEGVFSFQDDDEQWLSLRYDLTAPLARYVAENFEQLPKPYRSYREGWVFRNEKPGPGRFRQFMQFDADTVGSASMAADAEMCMMAADTMEALGIPRSSYVVKVNNRKVLDGVLEEIGLAGEAHIGKRLKVMRAIDKFERFEETDIFLLLTRGRRDPSGDFTEGAGLSDERAENVLHALRCNSDTNEEMLASIRG